jgi:hypothetical protein
MVDQVTDKKDKIDPKERCLALLTLHLHEQHQSDAHQIASREASDDDLIALLDGTLNDKERAHIMHTIANDKVSYRRWLELVETAEITNENPLKASPSNLGHAALPTLRQWFSDRISPLHYLGAVLASAVVVYLMFFTATPLYQSQIDELYAEFDSRSLLATENLTGKSTNTWPMDKLNHNSIESRSTMLRLVANGMQAGLDSLGDGATIPGVVIHRLDEQHLDDSNNLKIEDQTMLYAIGRLLTLSYFHCQQNDQTPFFPNALRIYQELGSKLRQKTASSTDLVNLKDLSTSRIDMRKSTARECVCTFTANIVRKLRP